MRTLAHLLSTRAAILGGRVFVTLLVAVALVGTVAAAVAR